MYSMVSIQKMNAWHQAAEQVKINRQDGRDAQLEQRDQAEDLAQRAGSSPNTAWLSTASAA